MPPIPAAPYEVSQYAQWPGVPRCDSLTYTCSHGPNPGSAMFSTYAEDGERLFPSEFGDLLIGDGHREWVLRDCKVNEVSGARDSAGETITLRILDRRWRFLTAWGGLGKCRGRYNRVDARGKLVPWSIRSPAELAELLFQEMGETGYVIDLPPGVVRKEGADLNRYLVLGENFRRTTTNPLQQWDFDPPVLRLAELADYFGCRLVFQPVANRFLVTPLGKGQTLPEAPYELVVPNLRSPARPKSVSLACAPVRIQHRFVLEPVAEEWDGSHVPIDLVSYAPKGDVAGQNQVTTVSAGSFGWFPTYLTIAWTDAGGQPHQVTIAVTDSGLTVLAGLAAIAAAINAHPELAGIVTATASTTLVITGANPALSFTTTVAQIGGDTPLTAAVTSAAQGFSLSWRSCPPPHFRQVRATDRLAHMESVSLAKSSVFRRFRVVKRDAGASQSYVAHNVPGSLTLPWFGDVKRIQQITLQPSKVEQVIPQPRIAGGVNVGNPVGINDPAAPGGILPEFYNGRSRDQAATVRGSVWRMLPGGQVLWNPTNDPERINTLPTDRVWVDFTIRMTDTGDQLIEFSDYVYAVNFTGDISYVRYPYLVLETACLVTDEETDQIVRWVVSRDLTPDPKDLPTVGNGEFVANAFRPPPPPPKPPKPDDPRPKPYVKPDEPPRDPRFGLTEWHVQEDLQIGIIGKYDANNKLTGWEYAPGDLEFVTEAARYYLDGYARKHVLTGGETRKYIGIYPIDPDGLRQQVTWTIGSQADTIASTNTEHSTVVLPYPQRRRQELLPPDSAARFANRAEQAIADKLFGVTPGSVR